MGKRKGSHGAGTWSFPGGHLETGESVIECARRETIEETGMKLPPVEGLAWSKLSYTNDVFTLENKHYVTLYCLIPWREDYGAPKIMEPDKCEAWEWTTKPPTPLFLPVENMIKSGFYPWTRA
jgi:8-oxo-dGTP diphosphatase